MLTFCNDIDLLHWEPNILRDAAFVAIVQIIISGGAMMVLFLFVVMLLNVPREDAA